MELNTIQKRNKLNTVYSMGEKGIDMAFHTYDIILNDIKVGGIAKRIEFQKGPRSEPNSVHGLIDSDLLEIVRDRLKCFQEGPYSSRENAVALTHIEEALMWMNKRVEDRAERNVLGTTVV